MRTFSVVLLLPALAGAQPPAKPDTQEAAKLGEEIEQSVRWYDVLPEEGAAPLMPVPVIRWRNVARGQEGEAMMVVWPHNGRPVAMASIYPWAGFMVHEFDSLSRDSKLTAHERPDSLRTFDMESDVGERLHDLFFHLVAGVQGGADGDVTFADLRGFLN